jgi:putative restriction endonuclease
MGKTGSKWTEDELLIAFRLYCKTDYGKVNTSNRDIIRAAAVLGRTTDALVMQMCNIASFDPEQKERNVKGLSHAGKGAERIWEKYSDHWSEFEEESRQLTTALPEGEVLLMDETEPTWGEKSTEVLRTIKGRKGQGFFRAMVVASYDNQCAMCRIGVPKLLSASHIIPWSVNEKKRVDPHNGLSLCGLHHVAFDGGLVTVDEDHRLVLSREVKRKGPAVHTAAFIDLEGAKLILPRRFAPDKGALTWHRENIFVA